ncbi:protein TolR [Erythrobacteraceae bacterium CFH 75059]|uniref:protein TolR n=1 Tax=Qipengyuania thermophila TaxID=2509361 RepID=UPI001021CB6A|nr:protein TolR [Qipengyuania thermophila]TCD06264.1 protein TolR [Erythrobacteraceae bacterium CFH 75059]
MGMSLGTTRRKGARGGRAPMAEINVTPFVDVMLVLLIIFMVTAPLLTAGVAVDLPDSRAAALPQDREQVTISMTSDGTIYLDDTVVPAGELAERLSALAPVQSSGSAPAVTLRADRTLPYGNVMAVMGELNRAGLNSISLVTNSSVSAP